MIRLARRIVLESIVITQAIPSWVMEVTAFRHDGHFDDVVYSSKSERARLERDKDGEVLVLLSTQGSWQRRVQVPLTMNYEFAQGVVELVSHALREPGEECHELNVIVGDKILYTLKTTDLPKAVSRALTFFRFTRLLPSEQAYQ